VSLAVGGRGLAVAARSCWRSVVSAAVAVKELGAGHVQGCGGAVEASNKASATLFSLTRVTCGEAGASRMSCALRRHNRKTSMAAADNSTTGSRKEKMVTDSVKMFFGLLNSIFPVRLVGAPPV